MLQRPNRRGGYELTFAGSALSRKFPRHLRRHSTFEAAERTALAVLAILSDRAAHPAIITGPGCGPDGRTVA